MAWARAQGRTHGPKTLLGKAAGYIVRNRKPLTRFLYVAKLIETELISTDHEEAPAATGDSGP